MIEDPDHAFRKCKRAAVLWKKVAEVEGLKINQNMSFSAWLNRNLSSSKVVQYDGVWKDYFTSCIWWLWRWRNELVFNQTEPHIEAKFEIIQRQYHEIKSAFSNQSLMNGGRSKYLTRWVGWNPPPLSTTSRNPLPSSVPVDVQASLSKFDSCKPSQRMLTNYGQQVGGFNPSRLQGS